LGISHSQESMEPKYLESSWSQICIQVTTWFWTVLNISWYESIERECEGTGNIAGWSEAISLVQLQPAGIRIQYCIDILHVITPGASEMIKPDAPSQFLKHTSQVISGKPSRDEATSVLEVQSNAPLNLEPRRCHLLQQQAGHWRSMISWACVSKQGDNAWMELVHDGTGLLIDSFSLSLSEGHFGHSNRDWHCRPLFLATCYCYIYRCYILFPDTEDTCYRNVFYILSRRVTSTCSCLGILYAFLFALRVVYLRPLVSSTHFTAPTASFARTPMTGRILYPSAGSFLSLVSVSS
jgi:hypothetical protein